MRRIRERSLSPQLFHFCFLPSETDAARWRRRRHKLADCVEHGFELSVIFLLQLAKASRKILVGGDHLSEPHERAHDFHIDLNGPLASQYTAIAWQRLAQ